ncbi:hypothetical protein [Rhodohalobacter sp. 614A]|uniref:hypothetical protein n=1 Tax=Rhodohalobacter sp. 614A TaxID=2908649 RepID=UPI001F175BBE|nr:hypothetical protein [Rhodohalobacter sp. 614A]
MKALNTEILLKYLVEGEENADDAEMFFHSASPSETYFLNNIVLHEVITSFEENVKFDKTDILKVLSALISNSQIRFESREAVTDAIEMYKIGRVGFSECLKTVINRKHQSEEISSVQSTKKRKMKAVV